MFLQLSIHSLQVTRFDDYFSLLYNNLSWKTNCDLKQGVDCEMVTSIIAYVSQILMIILCSDSINVFFSIL